MRTVGYIALVGLIFINVGWWFLTGGPISLFLGGIATGAILTLLATRQ